MLLRATLLMLGLCQAAAAFACFGNAFSFMPKSLPLSLKRGFSGITTLSATAKPKLIYFNGMFPGRNTNCFDLLPNSSPSTNMFP